ncbi:flagellar hook-basal body complex protein FliE [Thermoanaerobacterium thermosaccharolyticum]|uniref:Flagellar hook-basal body complex protein FliE n=2 Tax=Thermoanaerobacterium thermosaccharolyticum TaxID=1517 RepID=A0A231VH26_THETR|nr:flagellar hook-basal body complex protein FliE [Thermoanaerobacterium thermosaccharolyticum]AST58988.1 flagellar hook-basal body protein [Thermoanaerobacterium thermosaccharolyticum]MCP2240054.1 flagellar hook-basal body complex protein FliE [Thermoanaerobacterium thermosaccharolyticum]OXT07493.1 flagellar hook-basal body complex protein FliE [Thermoanaerobacterium thermosaccharolyticum]PHO07771.1 flagellar hook-basal body complex protein FliE [Thermoanaerobacterium thermosaccharolyticum]
MINPISQINSMGSISASSTTNNSTSFGDILKTAITDVNNLQLKSHQDDQMLVTGDINNIHNVMIDAAKADIALELTIQIKNKILDAYQEIMRMPV